MTIVLPDELEAVLRLEARRRGVVMAALAREILERELAPHPEGTRLGFLGMVDDPSLPDDLAESFDDYLGETIRADHDRDPYHPGADPRR